MLIQYFCSKVFESLLFSFNVLKKKGEKGEFGGKKKQIRLKNKIKNDKIKRERLAKYEKKFCNFTNQMILFNYRQIIKNETKKDALQLNTKKKGK